MNVSALTACRETFLLRPDRKQTRVRDRLAGWAEGGVLVCLVILAGMLPFAQITTSREIGLLLGLVFWTARMALSGKWDLVRTPLDLPLALLAAVGLFSLFFAVDPSYTLHELRGEMLKGILCFYLSVNNLRTEARARIVFAALVTGVVVMDYYGVIHFYLVGGSLTQLFIPIEASLHRGPQELGTYLVQTAPYLFLGFFLIKDLKTRAGLLGLLLLHFLLAYLTLSRMVMIALVFEFFLVLLIRGVSWKMVVGGAVVVLLIASLLMPRHIIVWGDLARGEFRIGKLAVAGLKGTRLELWDAALDHLRRHPFQGLGFGRESYSKKFPDVKDPNPMMWHAHNTYLNLALELGLQGLAVFLFLLYRILRHLWPGGGLSFYKQQRADLAGPIVAATWVMTAGYLMRNITDDLYNNDAALLFWLLVGCAFSLKRFALAPDARLVRG